MQLYENLFGVRFSFKSLAVLAMLAVFPNLLGMIVLPTPFGFKFHFFQILIFLAAALYGKWGGAASGAFGSIYVAIALNNPYIILGNILLGFFTGIFAKRINLMSAAIFAYAIQLPWLWYSDIFLAGMPVPVVNGVMWALLFSNIVWATVAMLLVKKVKAWL